jgi:hypothetical protein
MPRYPCFALREPWWAYWDRDEKKRHSPLPWAVRRLLKQKVEAARKHRGVPKTKLPEEAGLASYGGWHKSLAGERFKEKGLPIVHLYKVAARLAVDPVDLLPSSREVFILATQKIIEDYEDDGEHDDPTLDLGEDAARAYVEYHFQRFQDPDARESHGLLDPAAAERTYRALAGRFSDAKHVQKVIVNAARAIDAVYLIL